MLLIVIDFFRGPPVHHSSCLDKSDNKNACLVIINVKRLKHEDINMKIIDDKITKKLTKYFSTQKSMKYFSKIEINDEIFFNPQVFKYSPQDSILQVQVTAESSLPKFRSSFFNYFQSNLKVTCLDDARVTGMLRNTSYPSLSTVRAVAWLDATEVVVVRFKAVSLGAAGLKPLLAPMGMRGWGRPDLSNLSMSRYRLLRFLSTTSNNWWTLVHPRRVNTMRTLRMPIKDMTQVLTDSANRRSNKLSSMMNGTMIDTRWDNAQSCLLTGLRK